MSSDMGSVHRQGVLDTDPSRFGAALDSLSRGDPRDHARLATRLRLPTSGFTEECQRNHSEVHVLVHPNQTNRGNFDPGLFPHFSHHADRKSTRLNSSHVSISYAVFCLKNIKVHYYL